VRRFLQVVRRERPDRVPLIELAVHPDVVNALLDESPVAGDDSRASLCVAAQRAVCLHHRLGYDVVKISAPIPFHVRRLVGRDPTWGPVESRPYREWTDERHGPITTRADFDGYRWPTTRDVDFGPLEAAAAALPDGMALVGFSGGVLEFAMDLMGMQHLMLSLQRDPELVAAVVERVGGIIHGVFAAYCEMERVCAVWLGDDLGHKHGLLVAPAFLRTHVVPWYRRLAELAHAHGRPFLLHSCGQTEALMPTLVEEVGIDAKHSFEDGIEPVERFIDHWGRRVAVFGGVDVHLLAVGDEHAIKARTRAILEYAAARGGYAAGSGNSIPNYVGPLQYVAMVETVHEFNG
jgi:uroporphyrinogen decarboxylase